jgi:5-methylcytosine-specific restriction endonuclease McrA
MNPNNHQVTKKKNGKILLDRRDIERAIKHTKSNKGAARYLGISFKTYKKIASEYKTEDGKSLYETHNNKAAVGIPKFTNRLSRGPVLMDILEGGVNTSLISMKEVKMRLISEGYMKEECSCCGYNKQRSIDHKVPLIVYYVDGNKRNWKLENIQFLCYNCYFIHIADVFEEKQINAMEDYKFIQSKPVDFDLPKIYEEEIKESINLENKYIYIGEERPDDYGDDLIVRTKKK